MKTKFKNILIGITFLFSAFIFAEQTSKKVYVVPIQDVIDLGIPGLVTRAINLAETDNASLYCCTTLHFYLGKPIED